MTETECLHSCPLFHGLAEEDLPAALAFFEARRASYRKGDAIMRPGESLRALRWCFGARFRCCRTT